MIGQWHAVSAAMDARMRELGINRATLVKKSDLDAGAVDAFLFVTGPYREPQAWEPSLERLSTALDWPERHLSDVACGLSVTSSAPFAARTVTVTGFTAADALRRAADWLDDVEGRDGHAVDGIGFGETRDGLARVVIHVGHRPVGGDRTAPPAVPAAPSA
ncbi:hypothetical protein [Saccharothrix sp. HUAS TT1]|uniref:hypothetical protein n=1 Tax=unclassified Saccharothrix TaxID=2593673 RepID=UPI00345C5048